MQSVQELLLQEEELESQQLLQDENQEQYTFDETIDTPSDDLICDLKKAPTVVTRSLISLDDTVSHHRRLGFYSTLILFMGRMLGSGIFATPGLIFRECAGSYVLYMFVWIWATLISYTGLSMFLELASYLPVSGGIKTFLNYIFPTPPHLSNFVIGVFNIIFSLSSSNALVFGEYLRYSLGYSHDESSVKIIASILLVTAGLSHGLSKKIGIKFQNVLGGLKLLLFTIISITCFIALALPSETTGLVKQELDFKIPPLNTFTGSIYSTAMLKCIHSLGGWTSSIIVCNDIKNPVQNLKVTGFLSMFLISTIYLALNFCYLTIIPKDEFLNNDQLIGALLFTKIYGQQLGRKFMNLLISTSAATNVLISVYSASIMNQTILKEGFLPFSPGICRNSEITGTPIGPLIIHVLLSCLAIYLPNSKQHTSIYSLIISIQYYPNQVIHSVLCLALLFKLRRRFKNIRAPIHSSTFFIYLCLIGSLSISLNPFIKGDYKFTLVSLTVFVSGFVYWFFKVRLFPWLFNYDYRIISLKAKDGLIYKKWIKIQN